MKATICLTGLVGVVALCLGCTSGAWRTRVQPPRGMIVTQYRAPLTGDVAKAKVSRKVGKASTFYFFCPLFLPVDFAWEDASIDAAARNGGLSKVHYADYEILELFGIYRQFTVLAYGE